uniref:Uncharacterized protein n=1 Tax=Nomascus leucogenys TaxID=61853 RepID=A0A2I3GP32_NOMLE
RSAAFTIPSLKQRSPRRSTGKAELGEGEPSPCMGRPERRGRRRAPRTWSPRPTAARRRTGTAPWGATAPRPFRQNLCDLGRGSAPPLKRSVCPGGSSLGAPPRRTGQRQVTLVAQRWLSRPRRRRAAGLGELVDSLGSCSRASRPAGHAGLHHSRTCLRGRLAPQAGASGHAASAAWEQQGQDEQGYTALHLAAMYLGDGEAASGDLGRRC